MKTLLRIAAIMSFGFCVSGGLILVDLAVSSSYSDTSIVAIGLILIGAAFFAGSVVWLLAEKCCPRQNDK